MSLYRQGLAVGQELVVVRAAGEDPKAAGKKEFRNSMILMGGLIAGAFFMLRKKPERSIGDMRDVRAAMYAKGRDGSKYF